LADEIFPTANMLSKRHVSTKLDGMAMDTFSCATDRVIWFQSSDFGVGLRIFNTWIKPSFSGTIYPHG